MAKRKIIFTWTLLLKAFRADDSQMEEAEIAQTAKTS